MEMHWIEVDDKIFKYLQSHAEPFIDTPNSVLNKLFFGKDENNKKEKGQPVAVTGLPKALAYVLEVVSEIEINGYSRLDATRAVAERHDTTPTTVMDKYCRQLDLKAQQADELLQEPEYNDFKNILKEKFPNYKEVVDTFFESLITEGGRSEKD